MLCLFRWKILCEDNFSYFLVFGSIKKKSQSKTIFSQYKKVWFIFKDCFPIIFFEKQLYTTWFFFFFGLESFNIWCLLLIMVSHHQAKKPISFLCRQRLNPISLIQQSETLPIELNGTHHKKLNKRD